MNAVVNETSGAVTVRDETASLLEVISRAATNPKINIEKMERLLQMQERIVARRAEQEFSAAMSEAQSEMGPISADANNPQTKSKYASYAKLDRVLRPIYTKHGFALSFDEGDTDKPGHVRILCHVSHSGGHKHTYKKDMSADGKGAKGGDVMTLTHASGAAQTYGMRYLLKGIFNVAVGEDDNDGNGTKGDRVTDKQAADIRAMLTETNSSEDSFLRTIKADSIESINAGAYKTVIGLLEAKRRKK